MVSFVFQSSRALRSPRQQTAMGRFYSAHYSVSLPVPVVIIPAIRQEGKKKSSDIQVGRRYVSSLSQIHLYRYTVPGMPRDLYWRWIVHVAGVLRFAANVALCARDCNVNSFSTIIIKSFN